MSHSQKHLKHPLSIRLAESVVFLRGSSDQGSCRRTPSVSDAPPAMLRGLLTLHLLKPTRISSIEIVLEGKSSVQWPEASVHRRVDITEEKVFLTASTVFFDAKSSPASNRSQSIGPGTHTHDSDLTEDELHNHLLRVPLSTESSSSSSLASSQPVPAQPRVRRNSTDGYSTGTEGQQETSYTLPQHDTQTPPASPPYTPMYAPLELPGVDSPVDIRLDNHNLRTYHDDYPRYALEEFRNTLRMEMGASRNSSTSLHSPEYNSPGHSRGSSQTHLPAMFALDSPPGSRSASRDVTSRHSRTSSASLQRHGLWSSRRASPSPSSASRFLRSMNQSQSLHDHESNITQSRGRHHSSRWSLTNVTNAFKDAKERLRNLSKEPDTPRGRDPEPRHSNGHQPEQEPDLKHLEDLKSTLGKLTAAIGFDEHSHIESWKEFRKGTYNYPISFTIPSKCPPTIRCDFGAITYRLKAVVHRPGALTSKLAATREVIIVSCPTDDGSEDTHSIIVERQWDTQLRYLIALSGRSFVIGSQLPFSLTLVPMDKCKIFRLSVFLEEKVQYRVQNGEVTREQPVKRFELLSIKHQDRNSSPILPLSPEHADLLIPYLDNSPLSQTVDEALSSLMGPGPWVLSHDLQLPTECGKLHFTYKNKFANINVHHVLKIMFRVERGDNQAVDPKTGKRRLFDIVIQTPIQILSCHCNAQWTTLPRYSLFESTDSESLPPSLCVCVRGPMSQFGPPHHGRSPTVTPGNSRPSTSERRLSGAPPSFEGLDSPPSSALVNNSYQFARIIAGEEGVLGDAPPNYQETIMQRYD